MYVEEHGSEAVKAQQNTAYIQYIESTFLEKTRRREPSVSESVIVLYCRFLELLAFKRVHLWIDPADSDVSYIFPGTTNNRPSMGGSFDLKDWYYDIFLKQYWSVEPYEWEPNIEYPPFYGSVGDLDIKSDPTVKSKINEAIDSLNKQIKVINELLKSTCVVELDQLISEVVSERSDAPVYPIEVFPYNGFDSSVIFTVQDIETAGLSRTMVLNSGMSFDKTKDYQAASKDLIRRIKELQPKIHNWKEWVEEDF